MRLNRTSNDWLRVRGITNTNTHGKTDTEEKHIVKDAFLRHNGHRKCLGEDRDEPTACAYVSVRCHKIRKHKGKQTQKRHPLTTMGFLRVVAPKQPHKMSGGSFPRSNDQNACAYAVAERKTNTNEKPIVNDAFLKPQQPQKMSGRRSKRTNRMRLRCRQIRKPNGKEAQRRNRSLTLTSFGESRAPQCQC